jgi:hypothetical protein
VSYNESGCGDSQPPIPTFVDGGDFEIPPLKRKGRQSPSTGVTRDSSDKSYRSRSASTVIFEKPVADLRSGFPVAAAPAELPFIACEFTGTLAFHDVNVGDLRPKARQQFFQRTSVYS